MSKAPSAYSATVAPVAPAAPRRSRWPRFGDRKEFRIPNSNRPDFLTLFGDAALLRWGLQLRWISMAGLLLLGLLLTLAGAFGWLTYAIVIGLTLPVLGYNLGFEAFLRRRGASSNEQALRLLRWIQVPADLVAFTALMHFTGGATTPLAILYVFTVVGAILLVPAHGTYFAAGLASVFYGLLAVLELTILPPAMVPLLGSMPPQAATAPVSYGLHWVAVAGMLWLVAYVSDRLVQRMRAGESLIARQLVDLRLLYRFSDNLSAAPNPDSAAQYVVNELRSILGADSCSLMLITRRGEAEFRAAAGISKEALAAYRQRPLNRNNPLLDAVINGGNGMFAPDVDTVPGLRATLLRPGTSSFYTFPLRAEDRIVGLLNLSFDKPFNMPSDTYDLVESCSRQAGLAIERTLLYDEAQRSAREMESLYHIGLATSSSLEIGDVLGQVADQVQRVMPLDSMVLALYNPKHGTLDFVIQREDGRDFPREVLPISEVGASGWIVTSQTPLLVRCWEREVQNLPFVPNNIGDPIQSYVGVPLLTNNQVVGVLSVQKREAYAYDEDHLRLLTAIAAQAALALENAKLHHSARQQALRDSLTGAYNHAALLARLDQAVRQATQTGAPVSLIMLDIDLFKKYNDTFGHAAGDAVLRTVVQAIQRNVKTGDSLGRWGGEEFGVVLPGANPTMALRVAERIRATLAACSMPEQNGRRLPVPTASQGVATYPSHAGNAAELVDHADAALYQAKETGRDRIIAWDQMIQA
jgi:diguanylate cyclase (GGDEF)-like protein